MKIMFITGSIWMRDDDNNLLPFIKSQNLVKIFTSYGDELVYPEIYWYEHENGYLFPYLEKIIEDEKIDLIIGYSAGGYPGFYLCNKYKINGIHFNPSMASTSEAPTLQTLPIEYKEMEIFNNQSIIIGEDDCLMNGGVDGHLVQEFLYENNFKGDIIVIPNVEHIIPLELFKVAFDYYRSKWNYKSIINKN